MEESRDEGHYFSGWIGNASLPHHSLGIQVTFAGLRQAYDLLSAFRTNVGGNSGDFDYLHAA